MIRHIKIIFLLLFSCFFFNETLAQITDYSELDHWAAHPQKHDNSDSMPALIADKKHDTLADVFFIHPTTFTGNMLRSDWNADIDDKDVNKSTDEKVLLNQATVFNGVCNVYAPRYRQAHLKTFFMKEKPEAKAALDTAYEDVKKAFEYYLAHWYRNRPLIIASHSQGSAHAIRLLQEYFDGKDLMKYLVCAYVVGYQVPKDAFKKLSIGSNAKQIQCFVTWRSFKDGRTDRSIEKENGNSVCVNPITWKTDTVTSLPEQYLGGITAGFSEKIEGLRARIAPEEHILWVNTSDGETEKRFRLIDNYHVADYNLFYFNIRENVAQRVKAFIENRK